MKLNASFSALIIAAAILAPMVSTPAVATVTFSGSGLNGEEGGGNVQASAAFTVTAGSLSVILTNLGNPTGIATPLRPDVLTGLAFDLVSSPTLTLISISRGTSSIFTTKTAFDDTTPLSGSWTAQLGATPVADYGVAATGFNGAFAAGGITTGNGGTDYGIVAPATFANAGASNSFNSAFPLVQNALTFNFSVVGPLTEANILNVSALFGTDGNGQIALVSSVPEPEIYAMMLTSLGVLGFVARRKTRESELSASAHA